MEVTSVEPDSSVSQAQGQGVTQYRSLYPYVEVVQVAHLEKYPHISKLLKVDLSLVSPRPLG